MIFGVESYRWWMRFFSFWSFEQKPPEVKRKRFEDGGPCKGERIKL